MKQKVSDNKLLQTKLCFSISDFENPRDDVDSTFHNKLGIYKNLNFDYHKTKEKEFKSVQLHLDFGQKDYSYTTCKDCGMLYSFNEDDLKLHKRFHNNRLRGFVLRRWKDERIIWESNNKKIICVKKCDPILHIKKVALLFEFIDRQFGSSSKIETFEQVYIYVESNIVEGCIVAEEIENAYKINDFNSFENLIFSNSCKVPAVIGISRMWVSPCKRRQKIMTFLLENLRKYYYGPFGTILPKNLIAFSQPTEDGAQFAHNFFGTKEIIVYF